MWKVTLEYSGWRSVYYTSIGEHGVDALDAVQEHVLKHGFAHMNVYNLFVRSWVEDAIRLGTWHIEREETGVFHAYSIKTSSIY